MAEIYKFEKHLKSVNHKHSCTKNKCMFKYLQTQEYESES